LKWRPAFADWPGFRVAEGNTSCTWRCATSAALDAARADTPATRKGINAIIVRNWRISEQDRLSYWTLPARGWSRKPGRRSPVSLTSPQSIGSEAVPPGEAEGYHPVARAASGTDQQVRVLAEDAVILNAFDTRLPGTSNRLGMNHAVLEP
jgi:hypothetical protein